MKQYGRVLLLWAAMCITVQAGVVLTVETRTEVDGPSELTVMKIKNKRLLVEPGVENPEGLLFQGDQNILWILIPEHQRAIPMDVETMKGMGSQMQIAMRELEAQMEGMPPEQRAMMQQMMAGLLAGDPGSGEANMDRPVYRLVQTAETESIRGMPCRKYELFLGEARDSEVWVTDWSQAGIAKEDFEVYYQMMDFMRDMMESVRDTPFFAQMNFPQYPSYAEVEGCPVLIRRYEDGTLIEETAFTRFETQELAPDEFEVPENYTVKKPLDM